MAMQADGSVARAQEGGVGSIIRRRGEGRGV